MSGPPVRHGISTPHRARPAKESQKSCCHQVFPFLVEHSLVDSNEFGQELILRRAGQFRFCAPYPSCCRSLKVDQCCSFSTDQVVSAGTQDLVPIC
jgi:hypothetical protein